MSDRMIDEQLQRFSSAVAHASPDLLPLSAPPTRRRSARPAVAFVSAFAVVMLTVGLGALVVSSIRSSGYTQESGAGTDYSDGSVEAYWNWMTTGAVYLEPTDTALEPEVVGVKKTGPEPRFDPSELGEVQRILSYAEYAYEGAASIESLSSIGEFEFIPPVALIGTLEGTTTQLLFYRALHIPSGDVFLCREDQAGVGGDFECMAHIDLVNDGFPWGVEHDQPPTAESTVRVTMAMLPSETSVVIVATADGRTFVQRPVGGVAALEFVGSDALFPLSVKALDANGDTLAQDTLAYDT